LIQRITDNKNIKLDFSVEKKADIKEDELWVNGDWLRLQQICVDLTTNAIKYSKTGGKISITFHLQILYIKESNNNDNDNNENESDLAIKKYWKVI